LGVQGTSGTGSQGAQGAAGAQGVQGVQGINANFLGAITFSTSAPSGGSNGDIWFQYT
jgi:hypothetical protein